MSKKCYRYFGGLLNTQAKWLNKMAEKGYRLVRTGKLLYEFEKCKPDEVTYCVEFIGEKSKESSIDYANFLEDIGYKVFFKNINLNYSVGKARWRPWAERGGRIATNATTFNRELLIVEKANDGKPFELHTSYDDKEKYYRNLRNPWLFLLLMFALFAVTKQSIIFGIFALVSIIPGSIYQIQIMKIRKEAKTQSYDARSRPQPQTNQCQQYPNRCRYGTQKRKERAQSIRHKFIFHQVTGTKGS